MKVISQETFDSVVLENVTEFDNELPEAVEEAVREFEAQGVQLSNIVKNMRLSDDRATVIHHILVSLSILESDSTAEDNVLENLKIISAQCKISLAHRVLATKHGAYNTLFILAERWQDEPNMLGETITAFSALMDTNPDVLTPAGMNLMIKLIDRCQSDSTNVFIAESLTRWSYECCLKHERNRQDLASAGAMASLKGLLRSYENNSTVVKGCLKALRAFTLDDDIRAEFGKSHDHARSLVEEHDMIKTCLDIIKDYLQDAEVASEILSTVSRLCVRAEYCQNAVDNGALIVINDILVSFPDSAAINKQGMNLLKTISGNDVVKDEVMKIGASELIISALMKHQNCAGVCEAACGALSMLALRTAAHAKRLGQSGAAEAVVQAMKQHPNEKQIQKLGCMAARNLASRVPENKLLLQECQIEPVIHSAMEAFGIEIKDLGKAALRDVGLQVKLEEQWKGVGGEIDR